MDLPKMISELQAERDRLTNAILALERLSAGVQHKRGRPPKWLKELEAESGEPPNGQSSRGKGAGS